MRPARAALARRAAAWPGLDAEAEPLEQAELIEDAFEAGYFTSGVFIHDGQDLTAYMDAAMAELRAGRGAP